MRLVAAEVRPFQIAGPAARPAACVLLRDDSGRLAAGEAAPIPGFSQHTLAAATSALQAVAPTLTTVDTDLPPALAVEHALAPHAAALAACPTARFALETALLDLLAHRRAEPLATALRAPSPARPLAPIETSALLDIASAPATFVARALAALARGFRVLKVKLRAPDDAALAAEIEALHALRRAAPAFELRLDPNGRWTLEDARRRLARLAPLAPTFVEQPVPPAALAALGPCAVPWAADESLALQDIPATFSPEHGCAAFILKPAALGLLRARTLAALAHSRGLAVTITHFLDGPLALAAACETALSLDNAPLPCGLDPHPGLHPHPSPLLPHHLTPTRISPTGHPGLGLPPDLQWLR